MKDGLPGYDAWKTRTPEMPSVGNRVPAQTYYCRDCNWNGKALAAYDHHCESGHHRIVVRGLRAEYPAVFGCCALDDHSAAPLPDDQPCDACGQPPGPGGCRCDDAIDREE